MVKKQFCDYCGEEMDFDLGCQVEIYDYIKEQNEYEKDICDKCKKNILSILKDFENKK